MRSFVLTRPSIPRRFTNSGHSLRIAFSASVFILYAKFPWQWPVRFRDKKVPGGYMLEPVVVLNARHPTTGFRVHMDVCKCRNLYILPKYFVCGMHTAIYWTRSSM